MDAISAYEAIGLHVGDHFNYRNTECVIRNDRVLVHDYMFGDWIQTRHFTIADIIKDRENVHKLDFNKWHIDVYTDTEEVWKRYVDERLFRRKR